MTRQDIDRQAGAERMAAIRAENDRMRIWSWDVVRSGASMTVTGLSLAWPAGDDTTYNVESYGVVVSGLSAGSHTITFTATLTNGATTNFSYLSQTYLTVEERIR